MYIYYGVCNRCQMWTHTSSHSFYREPAANRGLPRLLTTGDVKPNEQTACLGAQHYRNSVTYFIDAKQNNLRRSFLH
jgi:hypothetical protein